VMWLLLPARRRLFVLLVFLFAMLALFPLRLAFNMLALQENGLAARAIHGSLWWGDIEQLTIGGVPLGNVEARLSPIQLFVGRARMDFSRQRGAPDDLKGAVSVNNSSFGVDDVTAHIGVGGLFAPLPVNGLDFDDLSVRFVDGACARAEGRLKARMSPAVQGLNLSQGLSGEAVCDGSALLLPLASQSGMETMRMRIEGNRSFHAEFLIRTNDPALSADLQKNGFTHRGNALALSIRGRL